MGLGRLHEACLRGGGVVEDRKLPGVARSGGGSAERLRRGSATGSAADGRAVGCSASSFPPATRLNIQNRARTAAAASSRRLPNPPSTSLNFAPIQAPNKFDPELRKTLSIPLLAASIKPEPSHRRIVPRPPMPGPLPSKPPIKRNSSGASHSRDQPNQFKTPICIPELQGSPHRPDGLSQAGGQGSDGRSEGRAKSAMTGPRPRRTSVSYESKRGY